MQEHECYTSNVSSPAVSRIRALSACHRFSRLNSLFCSVLRASSAPSSSPPPLTVSHRCSRVVQEAVESSRMLQLTPCSTSRWPLGTKSLAGTVLLPPTRALSPWLAIAARQGVGSVCSRAVHGLAAFDTDTCSGWERRRCEWLCAASSSRQERPCFARSTVSRAVSAITGRCSAVSHTGLCPCTQRPVRHRDPGRVDACSVPPPPSLPECRAAAPLAPCAHLRANSSRTVARNGEAAAGHGHAHVCHWDLHGRVVRRQAARTRRNGLHLRRQVRAARGRVCGRLRRHAAEAAWTREAAAGGSGRERGAWRVSGRRACPAVGSVAACAGPGLTG